MAVIWHPWLAVGDRVQVQWYGEDGITYDASGNEVYDANGDIVLNGQQPVMQRVRYINTTTQIIAAHAQWTPLGTTRARTQDFPLTPGTTAWAEITIPTSQRPDPAHCQCWLDAVSAAARR